MRNNLEYPVILLDGRNADTSWRHHRERGSLGGVDLAYPYGSPVRAIRAGYLRVYYWNGTGGNTAHVASSGMAIEYMHLSRFNGTARYVGVGEIIGWSGASGSGKLWYYSPHLHVHAIVRGVRVNVFDYFTSSVAASLEPVVLEPVRVPEKKIVKGVEEDMFTFMRNGSTGDIVIVNGEEGTYRDISLGEWLGYAENGWKFADLARDTYATALGVLKKV